MTSDSVLPNSVAIEIRRIQTRLRDLETRRISGGSTVTVGGSDGSVQYNDGGTLGGNPFLVFDDTNIRLGIGVTTPGSTLTVGGDITANGLTVDSNTLVVDSTNDRVGVNTTSPRWSLDVIGDIQAYAGAFVSSDAGGGSGGTNIDHIWHNDGANTWHFCSDTTYKNTGNSTLQAGNLNLSGAMTAGGNITGATYYSTSNGVGTNYRLGDDCWIGDVNVANTTRLTGVQNSDRAYLQFGNSGQKLGQVGTGNLTWDGDFYTSGYVHAGGNMYLRSGNNVHDSIYRVGGIFFTWDSDSYGTNTHHSIRSTNGDSWGDHITINSFGNIRMNIDSNANGSNTFTIGRQTTGTGNTLLYLDESANLEVYGGRLATSKNSTGNVGNASLNLGLGQGSGCILAMNVYNYAPLITIGSGEIFYIRNYLNSGYAWLYGYINNVSSKHHKTNIRTLGEPLPSVGAAGVNTFDAMERIRALRPVSFHMHERDALPRMPKNDDGTQNQRRMDAINRLDKIRAKNGLGHFERDDLMHRCARDECEGDAENPCWRYRNWAKGKIGLIAQEVGEVIPEAADFSEERPDEQETIDSLSLIAVCVKALQEIDTRLTSLEAS